MADLENRLAPMGFKTDPILANKILQELREPIKAALRRGGEPARASTTETVLTKMRQRVQGKLKTELHKTMDDWIARPEVGGKNAISFSDNARITKETLESAEAIISRMSDKGAVNFVREIHKPNNEGLLALLAQFDQMNGTSFVDETFELSLNRNLTVDQLKKVQGLARTVAPFLVVMRQISSKLAAPLVRPLTAATGTGVSTITRESKNAVQAFQDQIEEARIQRVQQQVAP